MRTRTKLKSLDEIDPADMRSRCRPRAAGYCTQTFLHFGGLLLLALLDSCVTCSIIPEEVLLMLLDYVFVQVEAGLISTEDPNYPICSLERYDQGSGIVGIAQNAGMKASYGVVLRAEFVRRQFKVGDKNNPCNSLYFKVLPRGTADIPGVLLGFPCLGTAPYGMGWQVTSTSHFFSMWDLHMPRAELSKRTTSCADTKVWFKDDKPKEYSVSSESLCRLAECTRMMSEEVLAGYDGEPFCLGPSEQAMVPAYWTGQWVDKGAPPERFMALQPPQYNEDSPGPKVMPGICSGGEKELMLCIYNDSPLALKLEQGDVLAVARVLPPGFVDHRADFGISSEDPLVPDAGTHAAGSAADTAYPLDTSEDLVFQQHESFFQLSDEDRRILPDIIVDPAAVRPAEPKAVDEVKHLV